MKVYTIKQKCWDEYDCYYTIIKLFANKEKAESVAVKLTNQEFEHQKVMADNRNTHGEPRFTREIFDHDIYYCEPYKIEEMEVEE